MRLAFIGNPANILVQRWAGFFAHRGHAVFVLDGFAAPPSPQLDPRITLVRYDAWGSHRLPLLPVLHARRTLRRLVREIRPDVLHGHSARRYGWQAGLAGFRPYVITVWGSDVLLPNESWRGRFWQQWSLSHADLVTAVSPYMGDAAVRAGARRGRVVEVQFGVDAERFSPADVPPETLGRLGLDERPFVFSPRAVRPIYNHETITAAFANLGAGYQLVMTGRNADAPYLASLLDRLAVDGAADRVRIIDDISDDDMVALYRAAGVVISAPKSDSFPITLLEAMACGTPIVAGDLPPVRAVLHDLLPDSLVPTLDVAAIEAALRETLELPEAERRQRAAALRERAVTTADYETNMLRMEDLYRRLIARTR
jgi:glycosyltransferase involved in cell wall biosynthesis